MATMGKEQVKIEGSVVKDARRMESHTDSECGRGNYNKRHG